MIIHMTYLKTYLKNIALAVLLAAILVAIGAAGVSSVSDMELRKSTYTRTEFDFYIAAPDAAQVSEIAQSSAVKTVFPCYAYNNAFGKTNEIVLMASDEIDKLGVSVLSEGTLIEGSFDGDGAMLDKTAADILGVKVGDTVTFTLLGKRITKTVAAIYLPSTFAIMEKGVVAVSLSDDMTKPAAYGGAFIVANDRVAVAELLSDYVGEGNVALTYEQYVTVQCGNKRPDQSDAEYEAECRQKYADYRNGILESAKRGGGQVTDKLEAYSLLKEQILTTEKNTKTLMVLAAIAAFAVFAVVGSLAIVTNAKNDRIDIGEGKDGWRMLRNYALTSVITAVFVAVATGLSVFLIASGTYFASECTFIVTSTALPVLAGIPVVVVVAFLYIHNLCKIAAVSMKAKKPAKAEAAESETAPKPVKKKAKPEKTEEEKTAEKIERIEVLVRKKIKPQTEETVACKDRADAAPKAKPEAKPSEKTEFLDTVEQEIEDERARRARGEVRSDADPEEKVYTAEREISAEKAPKKLKIELPGLYKNADFSREIVRKKIEEADQQVKEQIRSKNAEDKSAE